MAYVIWEKHVTEARNAVDGKRHVKTLYFGGTLAAIGLNWQQWVKRPEAKIYRTKREADRDAKRYGGNVKEI